MPEDLRDKLLKKLGKYEEPEAEMTLDERASKHGAGIWMALGDDEVEAPVPVRRQEARVTRSRR